MYEQWLRIEVIPTKRMWAARPFLVAYVLVIGLVVGVLVNRTPEARPAVPVAAGRLPAGGIEDTAERRTGSLWQELVRPSPSTARWLLRMGLPMLAAHDGSVLEPERRNLLVYVTGHEGDQPQTFFQTMLPFLRPDPVPVPVQEPPPETPGETVTPPAPGAVGETPPKPAALNGGQPLVGIYHTHDWESYISEFPAMKVTTARDLDHIKSEDHSKRTIMGVGRTLALSLVERGVATVFADFTHKDPGYNLAYTASRSTAREILKRAPSVKVLLDLHRDAGWGVDATAVIKGQKVAQIRCIVGQHNPKWEQNKAFCDKLMARLEEKYPGLTLPTRAQGALSETYNQDLMTGAILLEIGGALNRYEEAERSARYLAHVLAEMLRDGEYPK